MEFAKAKGDRWEEGFGLVWCAFAVIASGEFGEAQKKAEDALAVFEQLQNALGISVAAGIVLGATLMAQGKFSEAEVVYAKGLEAAKKHRLSPCRSACLRQPRDHRPFAT
jgi:hypothetical protein